MSDERLPELADERDVRRRYFIIITCLLLVTGVVFSYLYFTGPLSEISDSPAAQTTAIDLTTPGKSSDPIKNWVLHNEQAAEKVRLEREAEKLEIQSEIKTLRDELASLRQALQTTEQQAQAAIKKAEDPTIRREDLLTLPIPGADERKPINDPAQILQTGPKVQAAGQPDKTVLSGQTLLEVGEPAGMVTVTFNSSKESKKPHIRDTIPAGSFGKAILLTGMDAPTGGLADRDPIPVLLEMLDNGNLPNRYRHKIKRCRVIGSARGNISDERAHVRLERLTCVLKNGDIISEIANGVVNGEDGGVGMRGRLISKQGQIMVNAFLAGVAGGIGNAISTSVSTVSTTPQGPLQTLDPDRALDAGLGSGLGKTLDRMSEWYLRRADETYPVIEIKAGRIVDIFLIEDLPLNANLLKNYSPDSADET